MDKLATIRKTQHASRRTVCAPRCRLRPFAFVGTASVPTYRARWGVASMKTLHSIILTLAILMTPACEGDKCSAGLSGMRISSKAMLLVFNQNGNAGNAIFSATERQVEYRVGNQTGLLSFADITNVRVIACGVGKQQLAFSYLLDKTKKSGTIELGAVSDDEWSQIRAWIQAHIPRKLT